MKELLIRYEELIDRLYKSDEWLDKEGYTSWNEVKFKDTKTYQLRINLEKQVEIIQQNLHKRW